MAGDGPRWRAGRGGQQCANAQREKASSHRIVPQFVPAVPGAVKQQKGEAGVLDVGAEANSLRNFALLLIKGGKVIRAKLPGSPDVPQVQGRMLGTPTMRVGHAERKVDGFGGQGFPQEASADYSPLRAENNCPCDVRLQPFRFAMGCNLCGHGNLDLMQITPKPGTPEKTWRRVWLLPRNGRRPRATNSG